MAPSLFVSILLLGSCTVAAISLYHQQAVSVRILDENIESRRVSRFLEKSLSDLITQLRGGSDRQDQLHERVRGLLIEARRYADKEEERRLVSRLEASFRRYEQQWLAIPATERTSGGAGVGEAAKILETQTRPTSRQLQDFNAQQVETSAAIHTRTVRWMAWGLIGVGAFCALAGLVLGYGMTRGFSRSIHRLSVQIRDAAGKLGQDLPAVILEEVSDVDPLPAPLQRLVREIELVVGRLQQRERGILRSEQLAAVGQLAAGMAHEIRNPLTAIKMLVQTHREEAEARDLPTEDLDVIVKEIHRIEHRIQVFLDFARSPKLERRPLDLASVVEQTLTLIEGRVHKQNVGLEFARPEGPVMVEVDGEQIQQLLVNLALNALDAMPRGTLTIDLQPPVNGWAELRVWDTGPGITPQVLSRLFEPFVSSKETGVGLGLAISRRIAENHGGSLQGGNRSQGGACFVLRLPTSPELAAFSG